MFLYKPNTDNTNIHPSPLFKLTNTTVNNTLYRLIEKGTVKTEFTRLNDYGISSGGYRVFFSLQDREVIQSIYVNGVLINEIN